MKNVTYIFCLYLLIGFACCKKKDAILKTEPTMPPITSEGKKTIGCYMNGKLWVLDGYKSYVDCNYYPWHDAPSLYGTFAVKAHCDKDESYITMQLHNRVFSTGKYLLYTSSDLKDGLMCTTQSFYENFSIDSNNFINISRLDTINRIASGTFQFKVINENDLLDTLKVTDGRFDLKF